MMNWYVLFTISHKTKKIISNLNRYKGIEAFVPKYEVCQRNTKEITIKSMFNNYVFVKTSMNQNQFSDFLLNLKEDRDGLVKQLKKENTSALSKAEIEFFELVLDKQYIVRMSHGYQSEGITHVIDGPLKELEHRIVKVSKNKQSAELDLYFFNRRICMGIII